tara:strand:+ start:1387 stop:1905 length:519 start_codon:yes stop_codon:yes gene_type:complete
MRSLNQNKFNIILYNFLPICLLFFSVLNEFDFNNLGLKYFSFNFSYILIFYFSLKNKERLGYISIFIAGLFNDVINGLPIGLSSLIYLLLCGAASYLKNITLTPSLIKDWFFFLGTVLLLNSISYILLNIFFDFEVDYFHEVVNVFFTFLFYFIFSHIFNFLDNFFIGVYAG